MQVFTMKPLNFHSYHNRTKLNASSTASFWLAPILLLKGSLFHSGWSISDIRHAAPVAVPSPLRSKWQTECWVSFLELMNETLGTNTAILPAFSLLSPPPVFPDIVLHWRSSWKMAVHRDPGRVFQTLPSAEHSSRSVHGKQKYDRTEHSPQF